MKRKLLFLLILAVLLASCFSLGIASVSAGTEHQITFMTDSLTEYETQTIADGGYATIPKTPEKYGSVFEYWMDENGDKFSFATKIYDDITLTAKWEEFVTVFTVEFIVADEVISTQKVEENQSATAPSIVPCPDGLEFVEWDGDFSIVSSNLQINAVLQTKTYSVEVIGFNGEVLNELSSSAQYGEEFTLPTVSDVPQVDYHTFVEFDVGTITITEDTQIYLEYEPIKFDINYYQDGEVFSQSKTISYGEFVPFPKTTPSKENYLFIGWFEDLDDTQMFNFSTIITSNLDLHAKFIPIEKPKYEVIFYNYDGSQYGGTQFVEEGASAIIPGDPYREGYTFVGWSQSFDEVTSNLSIYATFEAKTYTVEFRDDSGVIATKTARYGESVTPPDASQITAPEGYEFYGWDLSYRNITSDLVITALYRAKTFVVMFYNEDNKKIGSTQFVEYGKNAIAPNLAQKQGYKFIGWSDGETVSLTAFENITTDTILFATYEKLSYFVNFYDGTELLEETSVLYFENANLITPTKDGFLFVGWFIDQELSTAFDFTQPITSNVNLYAKWEEEPEITFTVKFIVDGEVVLEQTVAENLGAITPTPPQKEGYTFVGWDKDFSSVTENLEVNAIFSINTYTITFVYGDKTSVVSAQYLTPATAPENVEIYGYEFIGWDADFSSVTKDMTVNAIYKKQTFTLTFFVDGNEYSKQEIEYLGYASLISTPQVEGSSFLYWITETGEVFSFDSQITQNLELYAFFEKTAYTITYYVDGDIYGEQTFYFGDKIHLFDPPALSEDKIFVGWTEVPETMPSHNLTVKAIIELVPVYYKLCFFVNGELYLEVSYLEGEEIVAPNAPKLPSHLTFIGWDNLPTTMPSSDLNVNAIISARAYENNVFVVNTSVYDGFAHVEISISENVNLGGFIASVNIEGATMTSAYYNDELAEAHFDGKNINLVWANGENINSAELLFSFELETQEDFNATKIGFDIHNALCFDEYGNIVPVEYQIHYVS